MYDYLPKFLSVNPKRIPDELNQRLSHYRDSVATLVSAQDTFTWENLLAPIENLDDELHRYWSPISHLNSVMNNDELTDAYQACVPLLSDFNTEMGQNPLLYRAIKAVAESPNTKNDSPAQRMILDHALRDFKLTGVSLPPEQQQRFKAISNRKAELTAKFEQNLLDATNAWSLLVTDQKQLAGLPEHAIQMLKQAASEHQQEGYRLTLEYPSYSAIVTYADDRELRHTLYHAFSTRASDQGPHAGQFDNTTLMQEILRCRAENARLLGYENFAELSLATKMAKTPDQVMEFLEDLAKRCRPQALQDYEELKAFARDHGVSDLQAWDVAYFSEKLSQSRYHFSQEDCRPYFPDSRVIPGMFSIVQELFGITLESVDSIETWHPDVKFFNLYDTNRVLRGQIYMDLYARSKKRGGAWMDDCIGRRRLKDGSIQIPVAYLTCNFAPPTNGQPALLSHDEVMTLFHEFGHCLQHLLTTVDFLGVSGINGVPWDAVELPSQFMENWCWEREAIARISGHYESGEPLPDDLFSRMHTAKNFQSGLMMIRQLEFSIFDFRLHREATPDHDMDVMAMLNQVRREVSVVPVPDFNRFAHGFSHIFSGGYAAGYYSYKWAEVLSADAYSRFEETGIFNSKTGHEFRDTILAQGGSVDPMVLFLQFRGREPSIDALLRHSGIITA